MAYNTEFFKRILHFDSGRSAVVAKLITCCVGDACFVWNANKSSIIVAKCTSVFTRNFNDLKQTPGEDIKEWRIMIPMKFDVTHLNVKMFGQRNSCLLWGPDGIAVVDIPILSSAKDVIAPSTLIGEKMFMEYPNVAALQVKWLPGHQKVVVVLNNDQYMRFYKTDDPRALQVVCVGPVNSVPCEVLPEEDRVNVPVDFDFGPLLPKSSCNTIFLLRSSGGVDLLWARVIGKKCVCEYHGSVAFAEESLTFKVEGASSIISTRQFPSVIAIGTSSGTVTHSVVLPTDSDVTLVNMELKMFSNEITIFTRERIEIITRPTTKDSFMKLVQDPLNDHRYVCIHDCGVHVVTIGFVPQIQNFINDAEADSDISNLAQSMSRYIVRWKMDNVAKSENQVIGVTFLDRIPQKLLCLLKDLQGVVYEMLDPIDYVQRETTDTDNVSGTGRVKLFKTEKSILDGCIAILGSTKGQPFMCSSENIEGEELELFLNNAIINKLEIMERHEEASVYLLKTLTAMQTKTFQLKAHLDVMLNERQNLKATAESIAEGYEERVDEDNRLQAHLETIIHALATSLPVITDKEKFWLQNFEVMEISCSELRRELESLQAKVKADKQNNQQSQPLPMLTTCQLKLLKKELKLQHDGISALVASVKQMMEHVSLK